MGVTKTTLFKGDDTNY